MKRKERFKERDAYLDYINNCTLETPDEVAKLFRAITAVIWDYKLVGKISDTYGDNVIIYREGGLNMVGVQDVYNDTLAYLASFPDLIFDFLDIYCEGNKEEGYRFGQVVEFKGTNLGFSKYGAPTGKSLVRNGHGTLDICQCFVKFVNGRWRMHTEWGTRSEQANAEVLGAEEIFGTIAQNTDDAQGTITVTDDTRYEGELASDKFSDEIKALEDAIEKLEINDKEDVKEFFKLYTSLVWNYKMPGYLLDYYAEDIKVQTANWETINGAKAMMTYALDFMAAFPDLSVNLDDIIVHGDNQNGYKVFRRLYFDGSNIGVNKYGKSTGKSLDGDCLCLSMIDFKQVHGEWWITDEKFINSDEYIKSAMIPDDYETSNSLEETVVEKESTAANDVLEN
jgi:predicted ester cyclase